MPAGCAIRVQLSLECAGLSPSLAAMTALLARLIAHRFTERFILILILVNAVTLGLETDAGIMARHGDLLHVVDRVILAIFVLELLAKLIVQRLRFFRDAWNLFDFAVVAIALVPSTGPLTVLRALRVLRVLRLITILPSLKRVVGALLGALPGMGSIVLLLALIFYVGAVMATKLFGGAFPEWFGSIGASLYTLFQIMTLESWSMGIVRPVMEVYPLAWLYFVPFILATSFTALNLFIGVVVNAMQSEIQSDREEAVEHAVERAEEPLLAEVRALRDEVMALKAVLTPTERSS
jgi:voltage-gated sodium channel